MSEICWMDFSKNTIELQELSQGRGDLLWNYLCSELLFKGQCHCGVLSSLTFINLQKLDCQSILADEVEQASGGWKPCSVVPQWCLSRERKVFHFFEGRLCWEYGNPPVKSLLLRHYCYHYHPYFERRSSPWGFFSLMFLCWWNDSSGLPRVFASLTVMEKHAQSEDKPC